MHYYFNSILVHIIVRFKQRISNFHFKFAEFVNLYFVFLQWEFQDADAFHPEANIKKMKAGQPLTDSDRIPWLQALNGLMKRFNILLFFILCSFYFSSFNLRNSWCQRKTSAVLACSALKRSYRQLIISGIDDEVTFVYLKVCVLFNLYLMMVMIFYI